MGFYDIKDNVIEYEKMMKEYNNDFIISKFKKFINKNTNILEIGSGVGKDFEKLKKEYKIVASDNSKLFVELLVNKYPTDLVLKLDASDLQTDKKFDVVYSNKVLQHLKYEDLKNSFKRQHEILNENGIIFHTFWLGKGSEEYNGLLFNYYNLINLKDFYLNYFELIEYNEYSEEVDGNNISKNDSFYIVLKKIKF
ncbi:methyltransferase family protein [Hypnocyclicus thermotrophus]|uniref:Methyltransferase family protein n=1 Tax=Hypnocyclicus thermotrophus TaxID=1627895 RepID=A0AA46DZX4_9FUSO|nr:class I SAM-dependent methyltransferase [Hypnocyclicus thermotrophus]TDT72025.1 methyltransferase family protein [Hypnocyclicus thermotrophus]